MSLSQALATAVAGLHVTQTGLSIVAANVANAETPGYVRKTATQIETAAGDSGISVRTDAINRVLDEYVQRQLRLESSGASYANTRAQFYDQLQRVYGEPGSDSAIETVFNKFLSAVQALATSPDSVSARTGMLSAAQVLAQQLNGTSADIQGLRSSAELGIADAVAKANEAMLRISQINQQLSTAGGGNATTASLLDQRDSYIDQLSQLMDIRVVPNDHNQVTVFTNSGIQLVGIDAAHLSFDAQGSMTPTSQWSADPTRRTVGTIRLTGVNGGDVDLLASKAIRSGQIAAFLEMRDQILVQAQTQLDAVAAAMSSALSDVTTAGTPVTAGSQAGFDLDLGGMLAGNTVRFSYTDNVTGKQQVVTLVRVDDPAALPLSDTATSEAGDKVIGIDLSGGVGGIAAQLNSVLATSGLQFSNPSSSTLRILDDGAINRADVGSAAVTKTMTSLTSGQAQLPFFLDASNPYTGAISALGPQSVGLSARIAVNPSLLADPSRLIVYRTAPPTSAGDATRPSFIYDRLSTAILGFSPQSGIGTTVAPFRGTVGQFIRQLVSQQGEASQAAANLAQGQQVVLNSLQQRFNESSSVNVDQEMATLLSLQNAYGANARVLTVVKEMVEALMRV
ncbi:MAG: flagellar hook-associated protein FlgK [Hyphomicrobiales bacterium]|nr:flagellar hook-associated protein FlgK [Hyphomicrobiales bacterium]